MKGGLNELALFAGAGGGILGGKLLGWNTIGAVEIEEYPRKVLLQRQQDGILPVFPIWDDIRTFDGRPWKGLVDIVSGGFPCQDISAAGTGVGLDGERSGLWTEFERVIDEIQPTYAYVENSPMLTIRGLGGVLGGLSEMGYNARWCVLGADDTGARHRRKRIWILAYSNKKRLQRQSGPEVQKRSIATGYPGASRISYWDTDPADVPNTRCKYEQGNTKGVSKNTEVRPASTIHIKSGDKRQGEVGTGKPKLGRVAHGVAHRVDRLKAIGNGQVPGVAATAFIILSEGLIKE